MPWTTEENHDNFQLKKLLSEPKFELSASRISDSPSPHKSACMSPKSGFREYDDETSA
jgi:hypothetical protein